MRIKEFLNMATGRLSVTYGNNEARNLSEMLLGHHLGIKGNELYLRPQQQLPAYLSTHVQKDLGALVEGCPIQYIIGSTNFFGIDLIVNKDVLIPRPETEELCQLVIENVPNEHPKILDIGTGSGCIAIALKRHLPGSKVNALDISSKALHVARENASKNNCDIDFYTIDILDRKLWHLIEGKYDLIVSNPPYVTNSEKRQMHKNVLEHEPPGALFVEDNRPLVFYAAIADFALKNLNGNGQLFFEVNEKSGQRTKSLLMEKGFAKANVHQDLQGKDRFVSAK